MTFQSIPSEYVILATAVLSGLIYYQSRLNGLESEYDRERHVNERVGDRTWIGENWGLTIDSVRIVEDEGIAYRFRKFLTGSMSGESIVTVRYDTGSPISESHWDSSAGQDALDAFDFGVEHIRTRTDTDPPTAQFRFKSVDDSDITTFFMGIIELVNM